jgi:RNA polymerase sigma-70 factor, ECF subfamily
MTNHTTILPAPASTSAQEAVYDSTLVERFNHGDENAFVEIMTRYRNKIFGIALSMLRNRADAEEITQDTFIRAHRGLARFRGDSSLVTWLHRIAVNLSRNRYWYFFRRHRHDSLSLDLAIGENSDGTFADLIAAETPDPAQENVREEFSTLVAASMERLDRKHREILTMRNVMNLPYEQIAEMLHISIGTVKSRIARARENLRGALTELCPEFADAESGNDYFLALRPAYGRLAHATV